MRWLGSSNGFRCLVAGSSLEGSLALIAPIESVVRSFDKELAPFEKTRGEEGSDHAKNDLLRESAVHRHFQSTSDASNQALTRNPIGPFS